MGRLFHKKKIRCRPCRLLQRGVLRPPAQFYLPRSTFRLSFLASHSNIAFLSFPHSALRSIIPLPPLPSDGSRFTFDTFPRGLQRKFPPPLFSTLQIRAQDSSRIRCGGQARIPAPPPPPQLPLDADVGSCLGIKCLPEHLQRTEKLV